MNEMTRPALRALPGAAFLAVALLGILASAAAGQTPDERPTVLVTEVADAITPVIADHVEDAVERAESRGYEALVVELDTPGGLDSSMRDIIQEFLGADVPVVVYVAPQGARAASAGALITFSAHVAAMAPGTNIGAATPVSLGDDTPVGDKIVNDAAAFAAAVAEERGRNVEFARETVTEGRSAAASDALDLGVVDLVADSRADLLERLDGREVVLGDRTETLDTAGAVVEELDMTTLRRILQWLADPNLAFLFLSIGTLGIIYELATPGVGAGGVVGVSMIVLAMFSLSVLPVDAVGFLFLVLALALFAAELFAPGIGIFAALGAGTLALAGVFLFREDTPGLELSLAAVLPTVLAIGMLVVVAGRFAWRARRSPLHPAGPRALVGREVEVATGGEGVRARAVVDGTWWRVRPRPGSAPLAAGDTARVVDISGLELVVERVGPAEHGDPAAAARPDATGRKPRE